MSKTLIQITANAKNILKIEKQKRQGYSETLLASLAIEQVYGYYGNKPTEEHSSKPSLESTSLIPPSAEITNYARELLQRADGSSYEAIYLIPDSITGKRGADITAEILRLAKEREASENV